MKTVTKRFSEYPFAHRQPNHTGHCRFVHGHSWSFELTFASTSVDACGFVIDFGGVEMKELKKWLEHYFDHTLVLNETDPELSRFQVLHELGLVSLRPLVDCSSEGLAQFIFESANSAFASATQGRVAVVRVVVFEDSKNMAIYEIKSS